MCCDDVMMVLFDWLVDTAHRVHLQSPGRTATMEKAWLQWIGKVDFKYLIGISDSVFFLLVVW